MGSINVKNATPSDAEEARILPAKVEGWMAWHRSGTMSWCIAFPAADANQDFRRCPSPLLPTREAALKAAERWLPDGGDVRLVRVSFE